MAYVEPELNVGGIVPSSGAQKGIQNHEVKDGDNIFRIMPPFGTDHNGLPFAETYLHWFADPTGKNRPLACSKKHERFCPVCSEANEVWKQAENLGSEYKGADGRINKKGMGEEMSRKYETLMAQFRALKAQHSYLYNAMDLNNNIKILRLPKTAAEALGLKIVEAINTLGVNPISLKNGLFFNIKRISTGPQKFNVKYEVDFVRKTIKEEGGFVQKIETSSVPESVMASFEKLAYDVHTLYPVRTSQELKRVMIGDKKVWEEMDAKRAAKREEAAQATGETVEATIMTSNEVIQTPICAPVAPAVVAAAVASAPTPAPVSVTVSDDDDIERLKRELGIPA